jgi:hypothetical protein
LFVTLPPVYAGYISRSARFWHLMRCLFALPKKTIKKQHWIGLWNSDGQPAFPALR